MSSTLRMVAVMLLAAAPAGAAVGGVVEGSVRAQATGDPLAGAHVTVQGTHIGAATGIDGHYRLKDVPAGEHILTVSYLGYTAASVRITVAAADVVERDFELSPQAVELDRVVYTATRTMQLLKDVPVSTELVSKREMEENGAITAADALETEIGVQVREDFSGRGVMLQGVDPERVLVLVDGNRVIGRINGSIDLSQLSTQGIRQIEVVKGALSTLYGSEAIGGVVNIITEDPYQPLRVTAEVTGGGYLPSPDPDYHSAVPASVFNPSLEVQSRRGRIGFQGGVRYDRNGLMDTDPATAHTDGVEAADKWSAHGKLTYDFGDVARAIITGRYHTESKHWVEDSGLTSVQVAYDDEEVNRRADLSAELRCTPEWAEMYSLKLYRSENEHEWSKYTQGAYRHRKDVSEARETYTEFSGQLTRRFGAAHRITAGGDIYLWDIHSRNELGDVSDEFTGSLTAWDGYLQDEWYLRPAFTLVPGVRYERHEVYGDHLSPKLSAMWSMTDDIKLRGSVGRGYRAPSSKELYFTFNHASAGYIVLGNENLEPETSMSYSVSLEHTYEDRSTSRVTLFHNDLRNLIDFDSLTVSEDYYLGIYRYENIVSAYTQGVELERSMRFGREWELALAYSYMRTYNRDTGEELLRRPNHSARVNVSWHHGPWNARISGRYTSSMLHQSIYTTDDQVSDVRTNPYTLWDVSVGRDLGGGVHARLSADNLFDTTHPTFGPYRGRVVKMTWRYTYDGLG